ncbi:fibrobacter succinogenes major paralogous domain-containing protein [Subsaxibacter sp. CAU 1640]|uniref:fibrobacter succinogenes major paralogous domain-containing protein n=1 Tax=Subsaxibacter sp. CAU 1640 TaxID=2933271 RepID=UPI00200528A3|nr:fibrobacter succinogenes major paralogous domain-containing protein [Subsaxibacter sp. CAU 1640]MCK7590510.1 fibrobacter succinogenes major paralogous domain-containing protein [Subsaxibacter sp. CAU 1640]
MKRLLFTCLTLFVIVSCSEDKMDTTPEQTPTTSVQERMSYKGIFTTVEGTKRGTISMTVDNTHMATAILRLQSGESIELRSDAPLFTEGTTLHFQSMGAQDVSWNFSADEDGSNPQVTDVRVANEEASVLMARESATAPVTPITGTYSCDNCNAIGVGFPTNNLTWNMMSIGEGDSQNYMTQVSYGGRVYTGSSNTQENCDETSATTECDINGDFSILGHDVTWSGTHTYGTFGDCSSISGTWMAPTYGASPGAQGSFVSDTDCEDIFVTDIDGNTYAKVTIGDQVWLQSNLNVSHYRNGDEIPQVQDPNAWSNLTTGAWRYYNDDPANGEMYGKLYNWYAVNDPRGLAPEGWHVASYDEVLTLREFLGGYSVAGGKMKTTYGWDAPNTGATNESGFSAIPGGLANISGGDIYQGQFASFWTSTSITIFNSWTYFTSSDNSNLSTGSNSRTVGSAIRCIQD